MIPQRLQTRDGDIVDLTPRAIRIFLPSAIFHKHSRALRDAVDATCQPLAFEYEGYARTYSNTGLGSPLVPGDQIVCVSAMEKEAAGDLLKARGGAVAIFPA